VSASSRCHDVARRFDTLLPPYWRKYRSACRFLHGLPNVREEYIMKYYDSLCAAKTRGFSARTKKNCGKSIWTA
jgi:hypothetical protein